MNSTTKKNQAFVVQPRTLFDFVATRDLTSVKELIDKDPIAVVDGRDENGYTALHIAVANGHLDLCKAFLGVEDQNPSPYTQSATNSPMKQRRSDSVDVLAASANSRKSRTTSATGTKKDKPLAGNASLHVSQLPVPVKLPTLNLNVNATSDRGYTPLHIAAMRGYTAIAGLLLEHGADPLIRAKVTNEPLTAYQYARKFKHPEIEYLLETVTFEGCKAITKDGSEDAAQQYVGSIDPIRAASEGNTLYFALALLDLCGDSAVDEGKYAFGQKILHHIRTAVCPETGRNVLTTVIDRDELDEGYQTIVDLLTEPIVYVRRAGRKQEENFESVFAPGPKYPSWDDYRIGYTFPTAADGTNIRPKLISNGLLQKEAADENDTTIPHTQEDDEDDLGPYSINAQNIQSEGYTALHYASRRGHVAIVERLLNSLGADATIETRHGQLAKDLAALPSMRPMLLEAELRKTYLDMYNRRNDVLPDDRPSFAAEAKALKLRWRAADRVLKGEAQSVEEEEGGLPEGADLNTTAPATPARYDTTQSQSPMLDDELGPRGNADGPTPGPSDE